MILLAMTCKHLKHDLISSSFQLAIFIASTYLTIMCWDWVYNHKRHVYRVYYIIYKATIAKLYSAILLLGKTAFWSDLTLGFGIKTVSYSTNLNSKACSKMTLHCTLFELQSKGFEKFRLNIKHKMHGIAHIQRIHISTIYL